MATFIDKETLKYVIIKVRMVLAGTNAVRTVIDLQYFGLHVSAPWEWAGARSFISDKLLRTQLTTTISICTPFQH